ncbi:hypothetical protein V6N11_057109 [Hibiscus sabdariffa]|uniref:BCAS3 domain-containing protein n=1 Tax=Hibiscus sabdariffa TaxID=183260 RepID=A0ABR1ZW89_9ROSI
MKSNGNIGHNRGFNIVNNKNSSDIHNRFLPISLKFIYSCIKTTSSGVRSASASVAASISGDSHEHQKDQVLWTSFDRRELGPSSFKRVLLLGYSNGFQVLDVEDASNNNELVSRRDDPVTFLQMQPLPEKSEGHEGFRASHPLLLVVACDESKGSGSMLTGRDGFAEPQTGNALISPTAMQSSNNCCGACNTSGQGMVGISIGYGPMAVGSRWLAYASNNPLQSNTGRRSPQNLTPSPGVSPSTSPSSGNLVARYAMESSWKVGRAASHSAETDIAGTVVVKDFVSRAVISQFRAHTSPISALCFDPSGTLLNGSGTQNYDWSSSHVHLYKLHRGMTSAVIQDICFSPYSQWIAIVSSRATCHIFVLSPFGGENVLQIQDSHVDGPVLSPALSLPWWSTPSFVINSQTFSLPPPTVTLSVISRIKNSNSWLNTVTNAASSAAGKASFPSGAFSAVFHNSLPIDVQRAKIETNILEHLLVYTPSGHVVQYKLLPSFGVEAIENALRTRPGSTPQVQDEELQVKVETMQLQALDVCRRTDWPEREECLSGMTRGRNDTLEMTMDQNSKVSFHTVSPVVFEEHKFSTDHSGGEIELEQMPSHEFEIRQMDLLPVFEHFHRLRPEWNNRGFGGEKYPMSSEDGKARFSQVTVISHSKLMSPGSVENSDGSTRNSYPSSIQSGKDGGGVKGQNSDFTSAVLSQSTLNKDAGSVSFNQSKGSVCHIEDSNSTYSMSSLTNGSLSGGRTVPKEFQFPNSDGTSDASNTSSNRCGLSMNMLDEGPVNESPDFEQFFQEEYCTALPSGAGPEQKKVVTDVDNSSSPFDKEKSVEEVDNDDMLGGVFAFSEEGSFG